MSKAAHRMSGLPVESREKAIKEHHLLPFLALGYNFQHTHFIMERFTPQSQNRANVMPDICLFRSLGKIAPKDLSCLGKYSPKGLTKAIQSLLFACESRCGN